MDFQELLSLGLGGAAIAILYVFEVSCILLLICCLFLISFMSNIWIKHVFTEQTREEKLNPNTHTVAEVSLARTAPRFLVSLLMFRVTCSVHYFIYVVCLP